MFRLMVLVASVLTLGLSSPAAGETKSRNVRLSPIKPGTTIDSKKAVSDGSQLVLLAKPRVAAGDVNSASAKVRTYASMFNMVLIAKISRDSTGEYRLNDLAVGNGVRRNGGWTIVSSDSHEEHGVALDFFARQVLSRSEGSLRQARVLAIGDSYRVFDAEAIVRHDSDHQRMKIRHIVWVNKKSGRLATMQWLLRPAASGGLQMVEDVVHALPPKYLEDRVFSVKADEFTFGVPSEKALAIDKLPSGKLVPVTPELKKLASVASYSDKTEELLVAELNRAIQAARRTP